MAEQNLGTQSNYSSETMQNMQDLEKKMAKAREAMLLGLKTQKVQVSKKEEIVDKQEQPLEIPVISDGLKYQYYDATNNLIDESHEHTKLENIIAQKDKEIELLRKRLSEGNKDYEKAEKLQEQVYEAQKNLIAINVERGQLAQENSSLKIKVNALEKENETLRVKLYEEFVSLMTLKKEVLNDVRAKFEDNKLLLQQNEQLRQQLTYHLDLVTKLDADQLETNADGQIMLRDLYRDESEQIMHNNRLYNNIIELLNKINNYQLDLEKLNRDITRQQKIKQSEQSIRQQFQQLQQQSNKVSKGEQQRNKSQPEEYANYDKDTQQIMNMLNQSEEILSRSASKIQEERASSNQSNRQLKKHIKRVKLDLSQNSNRQIQKNDYSDSTDEIEQQYTDDNDSRRYHSKRSISRNSKKSRSNSQLLQNQQLNQNQSNYSQRSQSRNNQFALESNGPFLSTSYEQQKIEMLKLNQLLVDKDMEISRWKMETKALKQHLQQKKPVRESDDYIQAVSQLAYYRELSHDQENQLKILQTENQGLVKKNQFLTTQVMQKSNPMAESTQKEVQYYENLLNLYKVHLRDSGCNLDLLESQAKILSQSLITPIQHAGLNQTGDNQNNKSINLDPDVPKRPVQSLGDVNNNFKIAMDLVQVQLQAINDKLVYSGLQLQISNTGQLILEKSKKVPTQQAQAIQNQINLNQNKYAIADKLAYKFMQSDSQQYSQLNGSNAIQVQQNGEQGSHSNYNAQKKKDDFASFQKLLKSIPSNAQ